MKARETVPGQQEWLVLTKLPGVGSARLAEIAAAAPDWPAGWLARLLTHPVKGLENYEKAFSDRSFWRALWFTAKYTVIITPILIV